MPSDIFIDRWLARPDLRAIRVAKELVKFNERCFVRLLGDMRSYNFVFVVTPDFEDAQVRIRAMDFDQQSYDGRKKFYLPQFFKENTPLALFCAQHLRPETAYQYQREEQTLMLQRAELANERLGPPAPGNVERSHRSARKGPAAVPRGALRPLSAGGLSGSATRWAPWCARIPESIRQRLGPPGGRSSRLLDPTLVEVEEVGDAPDLARCGRRNP